MKLAEHDARKNAARLARDAMKSAIRTSWLNEQVDALDGVPVTTLSQEIYKAGLLKLMELADGGGDEGSDAVRLAALKVLMDMRMREGELLIEAGRLQSELDARRGASAPAGGALPAVVTEDQLAELEALQRAELAEAG